jgi:hypothetical protein
MPGYKAHIVGGVVTFAAISFFLNSYVQPVPAVAFQWLGATILGALFPDVDIKSKGQGIFYKGMLVCLLLLLWKRQAYLFVIMSFLALVPVLVRHRGLFHQIWFVIVMPLGIAFIVGQSFPLYTVVLLQTACFFSVGALSHIILDRTF